MLNSQKYRQSRIQKLEKITSKLEKLREMEIESHPGENTVVLEYLTASLKDCYRDIEGLKNFLWAFFLLSSDTTINRYSNVLEP